MNKNLLANKKIIQDDFHLAGNITVGRVVETSDSSQIPCIGVCKDYETSNSLTFGCPVSSNFGSCSIPIINALYSHNANDNVTCFSLMSNIDTTKYEDKTFNVTRLDTNLSLSFSYTFNQYKESYTLRQDGYKTIFTSADVGKTISIEIEIV